MHDHNIICNLIGAVWIIAGGFVGFSFTSYDLHRASENAVKLYNRFILALFLFGLSTSAFIIHYVIHSH